MPDAACRFIPLPDLGAISVTGADAADFLAAQLSQAPPSAADRRAPLAAWHDAKGRVQALFRVVCRNDEYLLITHESVVDDVIASLRRFVLRAAVTLDVPADFACAAVLGDSSSWLVDRGIVLDPDRWASTHGDDVAWLRVGPELVHAAGTIERVEQLAQALPGGSTTEAELAEIRLGIPAITSALRGQYLPQMLNLDVLDGVAFDKGCYPGQEIIARAQNLGSVKRRMSHFIGDTDTVPPAASELSDGSGATVGVVVRAAPARDGVELLAVSRLDAVTQAPAYIASTEAPLRLGRLPYTVPSAGN